MERGSEGAKVPWCACAPQVHDFWHVLFGCHTNVFGEVALKAVEFVQVRGWRVPGEGRGGEGRGG